MLNGYDMCLNTTNYLIFNMQDFRYWLCPSILFWSGDGTPHCGWIKMWYVISGFQKKCQNICLENKWIWMEVNLYYGLCGCGFYAKRAHSKLFIFIRTRARCLQQKSWQKYDKSVPNIFWPWPQSLQGLNQTKSVNILCIFTKASTKQLFSTRSVLTEKIPVDNLCSLCIPVWHHNGSHATSCSGYGTTIVNNNNKLL